MTRQGLLRVLTLMCGLLVIQGCKVRTGVVDTKDPVIVLAYGVGPRVPLRYAIQEGSVTTSTLEISTSSMMTTTSSGEKLSRGPSLRFVVSSGPAIKLPTGNVRLDIRIVDSQAIMPPGFEPEVTRDFSQSAALLGDVGGWTEVDDRGNIVRSELNQAAKNPKVPTRLLMTIVQARTSLARVVFPPEPVGLGARWEARKELKLYGFEIQQTDRYTLRDRGADTVKLEVDIVHRAPAQNLTFAEEGMELALNSLSTTARGEVDLRLDALEGNARLKGQSQESLTVTKDDQTQSIELDSAFELRMDVSYGTSPAP